MDAEFWQQKWDSNAIAFHKSEPNPILVEHWRELALTPGSRVFVPLCGKTLDIGWLLAQGYRVVGAELVESAIEQLFDELGIGPEITETGALKHYRAPNLDIFVGNIFDVSDGVLGPVDGIYDRAALVALPDDMRVRYTAHLMTITNHAPQLLITFSYDQRLMDGPPFSISTAEVKQHYGDRYRLSLVESHDMPGGLKGKCAATQNVWLLRKS